MCARTHVQAERAGEWEAHPCHTVPQRWVTGPVYGVVIRETGRAAAEGLPPEHVGRPRSWRGCSCSLGMAGGSKASDPLNDVLIHAGGGGVWRTQPHTPPTPPPPPHPKTKNFSSGEK